jgi:hypothetical protein
MPTQAYFEKCPPFPEDLAVAELPIISFAELEENDKAQSNAIFESSRALGFFLLNFNGSIEGEKFLRKAEKMFEINEEVNGVDQDELMKYAYKPPSNLFGYLLLPSIQRLITDQHRYKNVGNLKIEDGRPDRIEFYNVSQDDMLGVSQPLHNPACIEANRTEIKAYMQQAHSIIELICSHLDKQLHLASGTLASLQPLDKPSGTHLRMLRCLPQVSGEPFTLVYEGYSKSEISFICYKIC